MKKYLKYIFVVFVTMLVSNSAWGLSTSGNWETNTITDAQTVNLTGNVNIKGVIYVKDGGTLTIKANGSSRTIKAAANLDHMFHVSGSGKLIIKGTSSNTITIDGGTVFTGGHPFNITKFAPHNDVTTFTGSSSTANKEYKTIPYTGYKVGEAIRVNNGSLDIEYVIIQNVYGDDYNTAGGIYVYAGSDAAALCRQRWQRF